MKHATHHFLGNSHGTNKNYRKIAEQNIIDLQIMA
jgi:hypothetical protein